MFIKYLISSIESLYMQMIHANYINNNTGLEKDPPWFTARDSQSCKQLPVRCLRHGYWQMPRKQEETGLGREGGLQKELELLLAGQQAGQGAGRDPLNISVCIPRVPGAPCASPEGWCRAGRDGLSGRVFISLQCSSAPAPFQAPCPAHPAFLFLLLSLLTTGLCTSTASSTSGISERVTKHQ